ncbi:MAG: tetratricopeptide repeat protein, partial [Phaeodactylibacter sp.]|nr:tetratricopeptide repeat protein [Phaeodactylibacter sp.]
GYLAKGDTENARRCFTKALELNPDNAYTRKKLAELE